MSRTLTAPMQTEVAAPKLWPIFLCELAFPSGYVRAWTGYGDLVWVRGSTPYTFLGVGDFGGISAPEEVAEIRATSINLSLSGIPTAIAAKALNDHYQGRPAKVWFGCVNDATRALIADPFLVYGGRMDAAQRVDTGETSVITISIEGRLVNLQNPRVSRFTDADQKARYPNDRGLEFIAALQDKQIILGTPPTPSA